MKSILLVYLFLNTVNVIQNTQDQVYEKKYQNEEIIIYYTRIEENEKFYLTGKVLKKSDNKQLVGMNIIPEGSNQGTVTQKDGTFKVKLLKRSGVVIFFLIPYKTVKLKYR